MDTLLSVAQRFGQDRPSEDFYNESATSHYEGIIIAVDSNKWTVDVRTIGLEQSLQDVRVMAPYYSFRRGHGIFQIPEVGSMCVVTRTQSDWIVVGFLPPSDIDATLGNEGDDASTGTQNLNDQFLGQVAAIKKNIANKKKQKEGPPGRHSFRSGREGDMIPGDGCVKTIAGNKIKWFTNGNILFESSSLCQRIMSKLKNTIIDICTSYNLLTPGFQHSIDTDEVTQRVLSTTQVRKLSSEKKPRLQVKQGFVGTDEIYEFTVFATDGKTKNFLFRIKDSGESVWTVGDPNTSGVEVEQKPSGEYNITASGSVNVDAKGPVRVESAVSAVVEAPSITVGEGSADFLVKLAPLLAKYNAHTHIGNQGTPTGAPLVSLDATDGTTKLKGG
ncbi:hypothetical protein LCGC14_0820750 [marine sediment metagenome]|uniref:Uncharacterized protein n=1 Tax=marine sediment metagenome TaxID=412755 RepID=A0A0F9PIY9_9ZZZZ